MNFKYAFSVVELLLTLTVIIILISLVIFIIKPEDVFRQSDELEIQNDKHEIETAYTKFKIDNNGDTPIGDKLEPNIVYKICRKEITDCNFESQELNLNKLLSSRLLKEIPVYPGYENLRYTGYVILDDGLNIQVSDYNSYP